MNPSTETSGKPADIPSDVWEAASIKALEYVEWLIPAPDDYAGSEHVLTSVIARAILAAKAEEREACAAVADEREAICADAVVKVEAGELYAGIPTAAATERCARLEAAHIARLIRKRGEG